MLLSERLEMVGNAQYLKLLCIQVKFNRLRHVPSSLRVGVLLTYGRHMESESVTL